MESGLVGAMIITRRGMADADGKPKDVDREFVCLYLLFDENVSWYLDHNIQTFTTEPKGVKKLEFAPVDNEGNFSGVGSGFIVANAKFAMNGFIYGTGPLMTMKKGERVRWYLVALGEQFSVHTPTGTATWFCTTADVPMSFPSCRHKWKPWTWSLTILEFGCSIATLTTTWMREW